MMSTTASIEVIEPFWISYKLLFSEFLYFNLAFDLIFLVDIFVMTRIGESTRLVLLGRDCWRSFDACDIFADYFEAIFLSKSSPGVWLVKK